MHELLLPQSLARAEALERCRRYLSRRMRGFGLMQLGLPRQGRDEWIALLAWQRLGREIAAQAHGFERRRGLDELESELEAALSERARSPAGLALSFVVRRHQLPEELLRRPLLEWKRDETLATFETRVALLAHARALAAPEGRLLLLLAGAANPR
ncbi:MAG: squalene/phytoene synthase family protein, partial [Planctomycetes bacterium]|nr:squalene/phytoene synthase family protein [Planctomycetota bacterium]